MKFYFENRKEMMKKVREYQNKFEFVKIADCFWAVILKSKSTNTEYSFEII